jgi:2-iminobutanoate/2-iminopropanoate deaminase
MKKALILVGIFLISHTLPAQEKVGDRIVNKPGEGTVEKPGDNTDVRSDAGAVDRPGDKPVAPYSPAVMTSGGLLFISGQIPLDPETGNLLKGDVSGETRIVMDRIGRILEKYGMDWSNLVKCTVFLTDIRDYQKVNEVYGTYFKLDYPAREAVEVANLPLGASIEISAIAEKR